MIAPTRLAPAVLAQHGVWVFDLDNTLYPASLTVFDAIGHRMTAHVMRVTGLGHTEALALQEHYHEHYGATVVGLMRHHGVDPWDFMDDVHDVDLGEVQEDARLIAALEAFEGRALVYTNGAASYAQRVLARLGVADLIQQTIALDDIAFLPKPERLSYVGAARLAKFDWAKAVMFEDSPRNLEAAAHFGCATVLIGGAAPRAPVDFHAANLTDFLEEVLFDDRRRHD